MDINTIISVALTILGFLAGVIYSHFLNKRELKKCHKDVIEHLGVHAARSEICLKSIEREFYCWLDVYNADGFTSPKIKLGLQGVENISIFNNNFIKAVDLFGDEERKLIEGYIESNVLLNHHYLTLNTYINNSEFLKVLYQIQVLLLQWLAYVETRYILCKIFDNKIDSNRYLFESIEKGPQYISEKYGVDWGSISKIINKLYNNEKRGIPKEFHFKY